MRRRPGRASFGRIRERGEGAGVMAANLTVFPALSSIVFCVFHQFRKGSAPDLTRDASLKKDTESFFREWLDASQRRTP
jgi:hypothetical protein